MSLWLPSISSTTSGVSDTQIIKVSQSSNSLAGSSTTVAPSTARAFSVVRFQTATS